MSDKTLATVALGVHREGRHLRAVCLRWARSAPRCSQLLALDYQGLESGYNPLVTSEQGKELLKLAKKELFVTAIDSAHLAVRPMEVQLKRESDIDEVFHFQAEPLLPFAISDGFLDKTIVMPTKDGVRLTLQAVKREELEHHIDSWLEWGMEPEVVSSVPHALSAFLSLPSIEQKADQNPLAQKGQLCLYVGATGSTLLLADQGQLLAAQPLKGGWHHFIAAHRKEKYENSEELYNIDELADVDFIALQENKERESSAAESEESDLKRYYVYFRREILRLVLSLYRQENRLERGPLFLTGELALHPNFAQAMSELLQQPLTWLQPLPSLQIDSTALHRFAVPFGLALTALPVAVPQINFRQADMAYPRPWRRMRSSLLLTALLCALAAGSLWFFGNNYLEIQTHQLRQQYLEVLSALQKDYTAVENAMGNSATEVPPPEQLSLQQIQDRLALLEKEASQTPVNLALFPNTPRVSDLLAWLGSHPLLAKNRTKGAEGEPSPEESITINSLSYKMVKRPDLNKPKERYQVQVDMEISSPSSQTARLFYDSIMAPNDIVDNRSEVKWIAGSGVYRLSFFLKDKTLYP